PECAVRRIGRVKNLRRGERMLIDKLGNRLWIWGFRRGIHLRLVCYSPSLTVKVTLSIFATASASSTSTVRLYFACSSLMIVTVQGVCAASAFSFKRFNVP